MKTKPYFRAKGKYKDNRKRIVIEWEEEGKTKSLALPKPEKLLKILDRLKSLEDIEENQ